MMGQCALGAGVDTFAATAAPPGDIIIGERAEACGQFTGDAAGHDGITLRSLIMKKIRCFLYTDSLPLSRWSLYKHTPATHGFRLHAF